MFDNFPKKRINLPTEYEQIFEKHYAENRGGKTAITSLTKKLESWMHKMVAGDVLDTCKDMSTLEIGAGSLNHLAYEPCTEPYDIVEPCKESFMSSDKLYRIRNIYSEIKEVPSNQKYSRIISIASLEHLLELPDVVARSALLLEDVGRFRAGIPNEGTILWDIGWKLTTAPEFRMRYGLDYGIVMKHEHVNTAFEIDKVLRYFFSNVSCRVYGLSTDLGLYRFYDCTSPNKALCRGYLGCL